MYGYFSAIGFLFAWCSLGGVALLFVICSFAVARKAFGAVASVTHVLIRYFAVLAYLGLSGLSVVVEVEVLEENHIVVVADNGFYFIEILLFCGDTLFAFCLLYTSDAADEMRAV